MVPGKFLSSLVQLCFQTIRKGLKPGERIVAVGGHKVTKGMTVEPAK